MRTEITEISQCDPRLSPEDEAEGEVMTPCSKEPVEVGAAAGVSLCGKSLGIFMDFVILL